MTFKKIEFKNKQEPAVSAQNLNLLQDNIEDALTEIENSINEAATLIDDINGEEI